VELPTNNKNEVLEYLALLLEAIPGIQPDIDIVKEIYEREAEGNTGLGKGVACPHIRMKKPGDLLCAVGWSPEGIDYGASDGKQVHIIIMYCIPDTQRVGYLKELSGLAKAVVKASGDNLFGDITDIRTVRNKLLDWIELSVSDAAPDAVARMIRIEEKQTVKETAPQPPAKDVKPIATVPFVFIGIGLDEYRVLARDEGFVSLTESAGRFSRLLSSADPFETDGYQIVVLGSRDYGPTRVLRECVAIDKR
jgi:mannitol/fructose-specific phosphotransferase system IIA component (Ntr-type)